MLLKSITSLIKAEYLNVRMSQFWISSNILLSNNLILRCLLKKQCSKFKLQSHFVQSAEAVEYTDCASAEG